MSYNAHMQRSTVTLKPWLYPIIFIALTFIIYAPSMMGQPFWDDWVFIFRSLRQQMDATSPLIFFPGGSESKSWPVFYTAIWMMYKTFKTKYYLYHATNILLHGLNGYVLWDIFKKLKLENSFLLALIFLTHPMHLFTVSWIIQLKTVLSIFFFLCAIEFLIRFYKEPKLLKYAGFILCFILSLLTKSTTVAFVVCLLFSWSVFKKKFSRKKFLALFLLPVLFLSSVAVVRTAWTYQVKELLTNEDVRSPSLLASSQESKKEMEYVPEEEGDEVPFQKLHAIDKATLSAKLFGRYISFIVFPFEGYYLFQQKTNLTFNSLEFLFIVSLSIGFYFLLKYLVENKLWIEFLGVLFFFFSLIPFCGIFFIPIFATTNFVPYWLSIPFLGLIPLIGHFIKWKPILIAAIAAGAFTTHWQSYEFINVEDIFINSIAQAPEKKVYQISLIEHYVFTKDCNRARTEYKKFKENDFSKMFCLDIKVRGCSEPGVEK